MRLNRCRIVSTAGLCAALLAVASCASQDGGAPEMSMLSDQDPPVTEEDRKRAEATEPLPLPEEPYSEAEPGAEEPSAMLLDLDVRERGKTVTPQRPAEEDEPVPLPEEPKPPQAPTGRL